MKNKFKKVLFCAALAVFSAAASAAISVTPGGVSMTQGGGISVTNGSAGPLDGAYACRVTYQGVGTFDTFMAVVTNSQGVTAVAPVSLATSNFHAYGYGIGVSSTTRLSGVMDDGTSYSFDVNPQTLSFSGSHIGKFNGVPYPTTFSCNKIF